MLNRRRFFNRVSAGLGATAAALGGHPYHRIFIRPLFRTPPRLWRQVGEIDKFKVNEISEVFDDSPAWAGLTSKTAAWLYCRSNDRFVAYSVNCSSSRVSRQVGRRA